jgi:hypothetical protein
MFDGPKLKSCSWAIWAMTRAMALAALVLGPPMTSSSISASKASTYESEANSTSVVSSYTSFKLLNLNGSSS